ncbi:Holliday junction resolvase RuvX [Chloroflexota bacterium]
MRVLGLDIGDKRIGVAMSDPTGILANPLTQINRTGTEVAIKAILEVVRQYEVERIIAGLPYSIDGSMGPQAQKVESFLKKLSERLDIPIETWDESYTTVAAECKMVEAGVRKDSRKKQIDAAAAAIILQEYLDTIRTE